MSLGNHHNNLIIGIPDFARRQTLSKHVEGFVNNEVWFNKLYVVIQNYNDANRRRNKECFASIAGLFVRLG